MERKKAQAGVASSMDRTSQQLWGTFYNAKPGKPGEIPQPGRNPETVPAEEPEPMVWPRKEPEIQPGREPLTTPPAAPPEVPPPPQNS